MSLEIMMMSCAIDAKERTYTVVTDILGEFLNANMKEKINIFLEVAIAELMLNWNQVCIGNIMA